VTAKSFVPMLASTYS